MLDQRQGKLRITDTGLRVDVDTALTVTNTKRVKVTVLLDRMGSVTGVDLRPDGFAGIVVMIGTHESVAKSEAGVEVSLHEDANGQLAFIDLPRRFSHSAKTLF